jgi:hypothetical protein
MSPHLARILADLCILALYACVGIVAYVLGHEHGMAELHVVRCDAYCAGFGDRPGDDRLLVGVVDEGRCHCSEGAVDIDRAEGEGSSSARLRAR